MHCEEARTLLPTRHTLSLIQQRDLELHLAHCPTCTADWQRIQHIQQVLRNVPLPPVRPPARVATAVFATLEDRMPRRSMWKPVALGSVFLAVLIAGLLISQFPSQTQRVAPPPPGTPVAAVVAIPTSAAPSLSTSPARVTTITFAAPWFDQPDRERYQRLVDLFNRTNPDVRVVPVSLNAAAKGTMAIKPDGGSSIPDLDLFMRQLAGAADTALPFVVLPEHMTKGYFRDLTPFIDADPAFDRADYYPGVLEGAGAQGSIYLLPTRQSIGLLSYNKELWAKHNLPTPQLGWNWNDVFTAAQQLADQHDPATPTFGLLDGNPYVVAPGLRANAKLDLATAAQQSAGLEGSAFVDMLTRVHTLVIQDAIYPWTHAEGRDLDPSSEFPRLVRAGRAGIWPTSLLGAQPHLPFAVGTLPQPALPIEPNTGYMMSSGTQHPEAAWRWLRFLSQQDDPERPDSVTVLPARKSVAEQSGYWRKLDPATAAAVRFALDHPTSLPATQADDRLVGAFGQAWNAVVTDQQAPTQALQAAQATWVAEQAQAKPSTSPAVTTTPFVVATPVDPSPASGATVITFSTWGANTEQLKAVARQFSQHNPTIHVEITTSLDPKLAELSANADCFARYYPLPPAADEWSQVLDLQPLIDADPTFARDDYPATWLAPFRQGGRLRALPYTVRLRSVAYNQAAFAAAGIAQPTAAWTITDLLHASQQLSGGSATPKQYGYVLADRPIVEVPFFLSRLGTSVTTGSGATLQPSFTAPQEVQALRTYLNLLRTASPHQQLPGYTADSLPDTTSALINAGRVGLWLSMSLTGPGLGSGTTGRSFTPAVAPPPFDQSGVTPDDLQLSGLYITATTPHAQACWAWLKYVSADITGLVGAFPARRSVAESDAFQQAAPAGAVDVYHAYVAALQRPTSSITAGDATAQSPIDYYWLWRALDQALQGAPLERALAEAQQKTVAYLACVRGGAARTVCTIQVDPNYQGFDPR
ncbi:MAG: extracellular solute-binding protein [Herpetosiphonaceae bacterium]|nr:extracellular solute-binding protein [Herpetosiphonaceae bacterium]